ncbi:hypothetical protein GCM10010302_77850 [Streptomyces polychromogenes]|uniref:Secreted protein n=1 Tax=Streptomyces polychromogenes TaxID=67342 RepID=A0ABN0W6Y3_9ACTN
MSLQGRIRKWLAAVAGAAALLSVPAGPAATADSRPPLVGRYLNLHQCVYTPTFGADFFTTVVPSLDGRFTSGTNTSATADTSLSCGAGDGNFSPLHPWAGFDTLDLNAGRYLNLHQCVYYSDAQRDHVTTVAYLGGNDFSARSNVSDTRDTTPDCGPGRGPYHLVPLLSDVKVLDLTAGRYVNLQQCVYYSGRNGFNDHFTTVVPTTRDGRFTTGTKVSGTVDTSPTCGSGDGNFALIPLLSGTKALSRT